jgi:hypothetical protein
MLFVVGFVFKSVSFLGQWGPNGKWQGIIMGDNLYHGVK